MTLSINTALANRQADSFATAFELPEGEAVLRVYGGTVPADADTALTDQVLLVEIDLPDDAFASSSAGEADKQGTWQGMAVATGTPTFFRLVGGDGTYVLQGTVSLEGQGGDFTISVANVTVGGTLTVEAFTAKGAAGDLIEPPPDPGDPETITLLGDPDFNTAAPTWWNGDPITGSALTYYQGLIWWADEGSWSQHAGINSSSDGGLDDLANSDDLYKMGRYLRERVQCLTLMLGLTRDLRFLDVMVRILDIAAAKLAVGYRSHNTSVVTWPASPYRCWVARAGGLGDDIAGTDLSTMNEVKWHATVAEITAALYANRDNPSPAGYNYQSKYNFWIDYLTNDFLPKWRGGGTSSWRDKYRGVRRDPNYSSPHHRALAGEWPVVVNGGEGHSSVSSTHLAYYMHLLLGEQTARDEFEWLTDGWLDVDCDVVSGHRIYYHTSPVQGSSATYAQRSAYVNYNQADMIVGRVLGMWPERVNDAVLEEMAASFSDYFMLPNFTSITSTSSKGTRGDIVGEVARGDLTSNPDSGRTMMQLVVNSYFLITRWGDSYVRDGLTHMQTFSATGTAANPKVPFFNTAELLRVAPLA